MIRKENFPIKQKLFGLTDQRNGEIVPFDLSSGTFGAESRPVWTWSPALHGDLEFPAERNHRLDSEALCNVSSVPFPDRDFYKVRVIDPAYR